MENKPLSIIVLSFNDSRVAEAIDSIRLFDDAEVVRLVVIDGGSTRDITQIIEARLNKDDVFVTESDRGIFDALNKGLDRCVTKYIGWLGSDDVFSGQLRASEVIDTLQNFDLLVANQALFRGERVRRLTHSWPSKYKLAKYGLHNPHFSTFGVASLLQSERFDLNLRGADIGYFLEIFAKKPKVASKAVVAVLQGEGGFSTTSYRKSLDVNLELISVYAKYTNKLIAPFAVMLKLGYKVWSSIYYNIFRVNKSVFEARRSN